MVLRRAEGRKAHAPTSGPPTSQGRLGCRTPATASPQQVDGPLTPARICTGRVDHVACQELRVPSHQLHCSPSTRAHAGPNHCPLPRGPPSSCARAFWARVGVAGPVRLLPSHRHGPAGLLWFGLLRYDQEGLPIPARRWNPHLVFSDTLMVFHFYVCDLSGIILRRR